MMLNKLPLVLTCAAALLLLSACKGKKQVDNFVHVDVYGQMNSRYEPFLTAKFRSFSHERATLPSAGRSWFPRCWRPNFYDRLPDPAYRERAQMIVLNSEQEAAVDPNLVTEFAHARKACSTQIPATCSYPIASAASSGTPPSNSWTTWRPCDDSSHTTLGSRSAALVRRLFPTQ